MIGPFRVSSGVVVDFIATWELSVDYTDGSTFKMNLLFLAIVLKVMDCINPETSC